MFWRRETLHPGQWKILEQASPWPEWNSSHLHLDKFTVTFITRTSGNCLTTAISWPLETINRAQEHPGYQERTSPSELVSAAHTLVSCKLLLSWAALPVEGKGSIGRELGWCSENFPKNTAAPFFLPLHEISSNLFTNVRFLFSLRSSLCTFSLKMFLLNTGDELILEDNIFHFLYAFY